MYTLLDFQEKAVNQLQAHVISAIEEHRKQKHKIPRTDAPEC